MLDILLSPIGLLSAFTLCFIFVAYAWGIYTINKLSKLPPAPPLKKDAE
jgi:hypothetical protein